MRLVTRLTECGLHVDTEGERVLVAPRSALTEELRQFIREHKPQIIKELAAAGSLESRRRYVERQLAAHPEDRVACHVADAPLTGGPGEPVSVVIGVRTASGIITAELHIPRERFDAAQFLATLTATSERPS